MTILKRITFFCTIQLFITTAIKAQCCYYSTYEDFVNDKFERLDSVYCINHSKHSQIWMGGNDYTLRTGNKDINKILKKKAFAVMQNDTIYVNCRNLCFEKMYFGNGYARAKRIGQHSLLFVNRIIGIHAQRSLFNAEWAFGMIGSYTSAKKQMDLQVCYIISNGPNKNGLINLHLVDDQVIEQMVTNEDLRKAYFSEKEKKKRLLAKHIIPILDKAGIFNQRQK